MKKITKRLIATNTWAASTDMTPIDLPREGYVTEISVHSSLTATLTAAAYDDYFRRCLNNIKITGDGGRTFLGMGGQSLQRMLSLWNEVCDGYAVLASNGAGIALAVPDVASAGFCVVNKFHPGNNPRDRFDMSACIPAHKLSTFQIQCSTAAAAVTDAAGAITAGTFYYEVSEVLPEGNYLPQVMVPLGSTLSYAHTANYTDFGYTIDVPTGAFLRRIFILSQDETVTVPRRKNDELTHVKLYLPKTGEIVLEQYTFELGTSMMSRYGCQGICNETGPLGAIADLGPRPGSVQGIVPAGFRVIDLREFAGPNGLDLRNYQTGDIKLGLTIANYAAGDDTIFYWDQLIPEKG